MGESDLGQVDLPVLRREQGGPRIRGISHLAVAPGTRIGPFRVDGLISEGSTGAVYEATQVSLRRAVALRLIEAGTFKTPDGLVRFDQRQRRTASLHHPNLVPYYEAGEWEGGRFIATRLIRGRSLARLRAEGSLPTARSMRPVVDALASVHAAGLTHGRITEHNILVESDGTPYLADLGLWQAGSPQEDERALALVLAGLGSEPSVARGGWARRLVPLALALAAGGALALALAPGGEDESPVPLSEAPPSAPGTSTVGSVLAPVAVKALGCDDNPSPNTPACTIAQTSLDGKTLEIDRAGVIRGWAVRGASGDLSLQVIRERTNEEVFVAAFSQPETLDDPAPQAFEANIQVRPGDLIGVRLGPGATLGTLPSSPEASLARWDGGLTADSAAPAGAPLGGELMLRADIAYGEAPDADGLLVGQEAASAPAGRVLEETSVALGTGRAGTAAVVELGNGIAVDVLEGEARLSRLEIPDADPTGSLQRLEHNCGGAGASGFCVRWINPDDELTLFHTYRVSASGRIREIG